MKRIISLLACLLVFACAAWAQDSPDTQQSADNQETITIPRSEFDALKARVDQMERELQEIKGKQEPATTGNAGGKQLALPDISLIVQAKGKLTDDKLDPAKQKIELSEAELGIQGYVYPNVKADAFIRVLRKIRHFRLRRPILHTCLRKGLNFYVERSTSPSDARTCSTITPATHASRSSYRTS